MIYTLDWVEKEAKEIIGYWNGSDDKFVDGNGDTRTEGDVNAAEELLEKLADVRELIKELSI